MRFTVLAIALLPVAAQAQTAADPNPGAQTESCPVGMAWDVAKGACAQSTDAGSPLDDLGAPSGCSHGATREIMS